MGDNQPSGSCRRDISERIVLLVIRVVALGGCTLYLNTSETGDQRNPRVDTVSSGSKKLTEGDDVDCSVRRLGLLAAHLSNDISAAARMAHSCFWTCRASSRLCAPAKASST